MTISARLQRRIDVLDLAAQKEIRLECLAQLLEREIHQQIGTRLGLGRDLRK
jgi:hypothetical protein